ncbi:MAG: hypothetical protein O2865_12060 [Planctomycetota bacterium]|nr:hypothetical protein [Planctomycetota bacterium]MDA0933709.1 hypothetical protein [Planctomycetota bacterium]
MRAQHPALLAVLAAALNGCGSDSPVDRQLGEGTITTQVGPGGAVLRGDAGTPLEGFRLEIPAGALTRLVAVTVEAGEPIEVPGSQAASGPFSIRVEPDPGVLLGPAELRLGMTLPQGRTPDDLFIAGRPSVDRLSPLDPTVARQTVLADAGTYDEDARTYTAAIRQLGDLQARIATERRLTADAIELTQLGYESLYRLTDAGLVQADAAFAEARRADPFSGEANLFRAVSRVLSIANAREDDTAGLDSVGEALQALGLDVASLSLAERFRTDVWPLRWWVPAGGPRIPEIVDMLRVRVRPALVLALLDLDRVPATTSLSLELPPAVPDRPGVRELDATDVVALRALITGALFAIDHLADFDLDFDLSLLAPREGQPSSVEGLLAAHSGLGRLLRAPDARTDRALTAFLELFREAFDALAGEDDDQADDIVLFPADATTSDVDRWDTNLDAVLASFVEDVERRYTTGGDSSGTVPIRIGGPWRAGLLSPRDLAPRFFRFLPVAGTLPDPTASGALPGLSQDRAADLFGLVDVHSMPRLPIVADGFLGDWTQAAEALVPADPVGDVLTSTVNSVDLWQVWCADTPDEIAFRIGVADGPIGFDPNQDSVYAVLLSVVGPDALERTIQVEVHPTAAGLELFAFRDGVTRAVRSAAAARGSDLEFTVNRYDLLDPDEVPADRAVEAFTSARDVNTGEVAGDVARCFVIRF